MKLSGFSTVVLLLFLAVCTFGQTEPTGYNPFVPKNLNDTSKLAEAQIVESSYHRYWIKGDPDYTDASTYVWYVQNGAFVKYDQLSNSWLPLTSKKLGSGYFIELTGIRLDAVRNASEVWVRWNDHMGGDSIGYVAVYERSPDSCVIDNKITGFKHEIVLPPEAWFVNGDLAWCADQAYSVTVAFNNIYDNSFPYKLTYSYPDSVGVYSNNVLQINSRAELDARLWYTFDLTAVHDLNVTLDEQYQVMLKGLSDKFNSTGVIAPLGPSREFAEMKLTVYHLPQTGGMAMDTP
jgi:hypothetical protein